MILLFQLYFVLSFYVFNRSIFFSFFSYQEMKFTFVVIAPILAIKLFATFEQVSLCVFLIKVYNLEKRFLIFEAKKVPKY